MAKKTVNTIKLGVFVLSGLLFLIVMLYMIGKNRNLFGPAFVLKAQFENVQGLVPGNNVRFSGIQVGTVKRINIINDTLIEVVMLVDDKMQQIMRNNAIVAIGSEGLMGNKVVNISPARSPAPFVTKGELLSSRKVLNTDDMLQTLSKTNQDIAVVAAQLKIAVQRVNNSAALWAILNDETLPQNLRSAAANVQQATARAAIVASDLQSIIGSVKNGKGSLGAVLTDTSFAVSLHDAIEKIKGVGDKADELAVSLNSVITGVKQDYNTGRGPVNALFKDSSMVVSISKSLDNIQKGTDAFNQNMEALKHNFLFRGYFRKLEKQKSKENRQGFAAQ
ncbi:mammalian cell entry protein [Niastella vici]|uniref:Mammalian cell entry protein n=1 Tax=Niastella vici TaxID=1703345 RepID=A0A1V9FZL2_9BACT|nr:MlaD family protein [Niastella vici]OQP63770.1 mammalian cell entry protein [Niastella vici]